MQYIREAGLPILKSSYFLMDLALYGVGDEELFMKSVVLRLTDIAKQTWNSEIDSGPKLSTYREFKSLINPEKYLYTLNNIYTLYGSNLPNLEYLTTS